MDYTNQDRRDFIEKMVYERGLDFIAGIEIGAKQTAAVLRKIADDMDGQTTMPVLTLRQLKRNLEAKKDGRDIYED